MTTPLIHIAFDPNGIWAYSRFPDPFITVDYDGHGRLIGVSVSGPHVNHLRKSLCALDCGDIEFNRRFTQEVSNALGATA